MLKNLGIAAKPNPSEAERQTAGDAAELGRPAQGLQKAVGRFQD